MMISKLVKNGGNSLHLQHTYPFSSPPPPPPPLLHFLYPSTPSSPLPLLSPPSLLSLLPHQWSLETLEFHCRVSPQLGGPCRGCPPNPPDQSHIPHQCLVLWLSCSSGTLLWSLCLHRLPHLFECLHHWRMINGPCVSSGLQWTLASYSIPRSSFSLHLLFLCFLPFCIWGRHFYTLQTSLYLEGDTPPYGVQKWASKRPLLRVGMGPGALLSALQTVLQVDFTV